MRFNGFLRECLKQGTPSLRFSGLVLKFFKTKKGKSTRLEYTIIEVTNYV